MKLTTHLHLLPRLRKSAPTPPLPYMAFKARTKKTIFYFTGMCLILSQCHPLLQVICPRSAKTECSVPFPQQLVTESLYAKALE
jgi:hypothetical protein